MLCLLLSLFLVMFVFFRMEAVQLVFTSLGAVMGAIGLMILFVGVLATGATRTKVYNKLGARVGGRISCVIVSSGGCLPCVLTQFLFSFSLWGLDIF